jgi:hypothetical protein
MLAVRMKVLADASPIRPDDSPNYAGNLFDVLLEDPEILRSTQWAWLETADDALAIDVPSWRVGLCITWSPTAPAIRGIGACATPLHERAHTAPRSSAMTTRSTTIGRALQPGIHFGSKTRRLKRSDARQE